MIDYLLTERRGVLFGAAVLVGAGSAMFLDAIGVLLHL